MTLRVGGAAPPDPVRFKHEAFKDFAQRSPDPERFKHEAFKDFAQSAPDPERYRLKRIRIQ